jgi:uncharacterized RDD family membrane protein YckC
MSGGTRHVPGDSLPPAARDVQGLRAGVVSRLIAGGIDYATVALLTLGAYVGLVLLRFLIDPRNYRLPSWTFGTYIIVGLVFMMLYLWGCWATYGRTLGNRAMGLRVVSRNGGRVNWFTALVRSVACTIVPIGLVWCAVSRENRSLQDIIFRTSVIHDWPRALVDVEILNTQDRRLDLGHAGPTTPDA